MKKPRRDECENIVELLAKDYLAKHRSDLNNKIGRIAADFIERGLSNSTAMVTKQMSANFEYLDGMINYVIESLKKDFDYIPLGNCKDKLVTILETEYKGLIPFINSLLISTGLATQSTLDSFQKRVLDELEKAKEKIKIQCEISERKKVVSKDKGGKWYQSRTIQGALISAGALVFVSFVGWLITLYINKPNNHSNMGIMEPTTEKIVGYSSPSTIHSGPNSVNYDSPQLEKLDKQPSPIIKKDEASIEPEDREGDVNRPIQSPIIRKDERPIEPEETEGKVKEPYK